jgi:hypothetical protein
MSPPDEPTSDKPAFRELNMEELDSIVGGGAPFAAHSAVDKVAAFETPFAHLDAVALTSAKVEMVSNTVHSGQITNVIPSLTELGETESLRLQMAMDRTSKLETTLSNLLNTEHHTEQDITRNLK